MRAASGVVTVLVCASLAGCAREPSQRHFATPEEAVRALTDTVKAGTLDELLTYFGPEGRDLVASSDPATGRRNQEVFVAAMAEGWHLEDRGPTTKELIVGNEEWPFPIPLVKGDDGWHFDAAAGKDEVLARRIGRNELAAIDVIRTYVVAQRVYARSGHDGKPAGIYARKFRSDPNTQNGLYWPVKRGEPRSPLGDLVAAASEDGADLASRTEPAPFHGYYFRILTAQGAAAPGGEADYVKSGEMTGGFALVAWPAQYDTTGVMSFVVGRAGIVFEKDLGADTAAAVKAITRYDPDASWQRTESDAAPQAR
jgi:hypothetical protein